MEPQQHPNEHSSSKESSGFVCRQSSSNTTRWSPTTDQIRILKDLYHNNGIRSPSADQIQRISARLRQYGKIEGKNVFYWFQNHKARERQKKRFTTTTDLHVHVPMQTSSTVSNTASWKLPAYSPSSTGVPTVGQIGYYGYGSMAMEKSFRDCSISACGGSKSESLISHNFRWVDIDPAYSSSCLFDQKKIINEILEDDEEEEEKAAFSPQIETLPLFPLHDDDDHDINNINGFCNNNIDKPAESESCYSTAASHRASLELSLDSYTARSQD